MVFYRFYLGIDVLIKALKTDDKNGINQLTISERIEAFGSNQPPVKEIMTCFEHFKEALKDQTLIILMVAAVVSIFINMATEEDHRELGKPTLLV